jgi:thioredoxin-like negative regulator of GroEL
MSVHDLIASVRAWRQPERVTRVTAEELGLDRLPPLALLLQFSSIGSRSCRDALNRLAEAAARTDGRVSVLELSLRRHSTLQTRLGVRFTPSVYVVAADGAVVGHWARPPERDELEQALAALASRQPTAVTA